MIADDVETVDLGEHFEEEYFDYVIMGDVLECIRNPEAVLNKLYPYLKRKGRLIISIPNVRHYSVILPLLNDDRFEYKQEGILSTDSVRLHTENEAARLISAGGYSIRNIKQNISDDLEEEDRKELQAIAKLTGELDISDFLVKSYIFTAEKSVG